MKNKLFLSFIHLLVITSAVYADQEWLTYRKTIIDTLTAIEFDGDKVWLGTNNGIGLYDTSTGKATDFPWNDTFIPIIIQDIEVDRDETGWIATNNGIWKLKEGDLTLLEETDNQDIIAVEIDKNNVKWFITNETLLRFDGSEWKVFTAVNGLPVVSLTTLAIDNTNTLWIGTQKNGIISFDGTEWTLYDVIKPDAIATTVDGENRIWFGDYHGKVYSYDGSEWTSVQAVSKQWFLHSIDVDRNGVLWAASNKGVYRTESGETTIYTEEDGLASTFSQIVKVDDRDDRTVWTVGLGVRALSKFDGNIFKRVNFALTGPVENIVYSIAIDQDNVKWFGHKTDGISRYDNIKWSELRFTNYSNLGGDIEVDAYNTKWITTDMGYTLSYKDELFHDYPLVVDLTSCPHIADHIVAESNNRVWIYGISGCDYRESSNLFYYDYDGENIIYNAYMNIGRDAAIAIDKHNNLWISRPRYGFITFIDYVTRHDTDFKRSENERYYFSKIYVDNTDILWSFSERGINVYDDKIWTNYSSENTPLPSNNVLAMIEDRNNTKWIGTDAGVCRFDGETWTTFNTANSGLCDNTVNAIAVEKNNTIWFGTDNGVSRYTGEIITTSVDGDDETPKALPVLHSYPNPFNPSTTIEFILPESGFASLSIYNISGQKVRELAADHMTAGMHSLVWDGRDDSGNAVSSGVYITRLVAGKQGAAGRMVLLK